MTENGISISSVLKFPSHIESLGFSSFIKFFEQLEYLPDKFQKEDVANLEGYPVNNIKTIGRILSYLKYLGFVDEQRIWADKKQFWTLTDKALTLKKALHFQKEKYPELLKVSLMDTDLYRFLAEQDEIKNYNKIKISVLDSIIYDYDKAKTKMTPETAKKGRKFMIDLLREVGLVLIENDIIMLSQDIEIIEETKEEEESEEDVGEKPPKEDGEELSPIPPKSDAKIHFEEKGSWSLYILDDFDEDSYKILEVVLKKVRKLYNIQNNNQEPNE